MLLLSPTRFKDYELIDCGDFEKLERFGPYITIRPEPQAVWDRRLSKREWERQAHVRFEPKSSSSGNWRKLKEMPDRWQMGYNLEKADNGQSPRINFRLGLTSFKHVGIFPEQAVNWEYIHGCVRKMKTEKPKVLNLFAYTGGASLAAKAAGADTTHLDSVKQVVTWARENMELSDLNDIRWVVEDAFTFVKREVKRGKKYQGIILDPPAYGHGTEGQKWKLEDMINEMMKQVVELLDEKEHFLLLNTYSLGFSSLIIENLLDHRKGLETGELFLKSSAGDALPLGVFGRIFHQSN
jgi:23S rRNA (cytosine1962-C5)-methyltransferase